MAASIISTSQLSSVPFASPSLRANADNAIALPIFALMAIIITYLPLRSFYRVRNTSALSIVVVTLILNVMTFVNALLWPNDDWSSWFWGTGLCDVEVQLRYPITLVLACSLCSLSKGLADALDTEHARFGQTTSQKRRELARDVCSCWGAPVLQMALHYTVQSGRFMVVPVFGCADQIDNSWPTVVVIVVPFLLAAVLNMYYAVLMLIRLHKHRRTISAALTTTGSGLAPKKFIKLVIISLSLLIIYVPLQTVFMYAASPHSFTPYSWTRVHDPITWSPILFINTDYDSTMQFFGWAGIAMSFMVWVYFGFNDDAVDTYRHFLVVLGAGRLWPSLRLTRVQRMRRGSEKSGKSFGSHFDVVEKVMKYFDRERKDSRATTVVGDVSMHNKSRQDSQATFTNIALANVSTAGSSSLHKSMASPTSSTFPGDIQDSDAITPAPSPFDVATVLPLHRSSAVAAQHPRSNNGIFSLFRTHLHLPNNLFASSSASNPQDINNDFTHQPSTTVHTSIWSSPSPANHTHFSTHSPFHSTPSTTTTAPNSSSSTAPLTSPPIQDEDLDPLAPSMGTRAYRERERRELAEAKRKAKFGNKKAEDVMGMNVQGGVVMVKTRIETREEVEG